MSAAATEQRILRTFTVPGPPTPHPRATGMEFKRGSRRTAKYMAYKSLVGWSYKAAHPGAELFIGPVCLTVVFQQPDPWLRGCRRYDLTNCVKSLEDGLTGVAYIDDWQVGEQRVSLEYGKEPCAVVTVAGRVEVV